MALRRRARKIIGDAITRIRIYVECVVKFFGNFSFTACQSEHRIEDESRKVN